MDIIELFIEDENEFSGIDAISVVENPAIEEDFVALKNQEFKLAEVDTEKRILMGPALIPNKPIYRKSGDKEYYIYFSKNTVKKASELFLMRGKQNNSTFEHQVPLQGMSVVESWLVEDDEKDKSRKYDLNVPVGTWMVSMKVNNDEVWQEVKAGKVKGFSIEGYFADKIERPQDKSIKDELAEIENEEAEYLLATIKGVIKKDKRYKNGQVMELESYSDYPSGVKNNAKRGLELNEKVNNKCATQVGKVRAQQLAQGKPISVQTIKRMHSYLSRSETYYDEGDTKACGTISYLLWGGKAGKRWAESKLKELGVIDLKEPCWEGYEMVGFKIKDGKKVPNCVPSENLSKHNIELDKVQQLQSALDSAINDYDKGLKQINSTAKNSFLRSQKKFQKLAIEFKDLIKKAQDLGVKDVEAEFKRLYKICDDYYIQCDIYADAAAKFR